MARADKNSITEYLLGRLTESDDEQVELRLLTDPEFAEEYDIVVNEVVDDYISGKFEGEDLKQVEDYFFKHPERRNKLKFALALKRRKSEMAKPKPRPKNYTPYLAIAASVLLVVGGFFIWRAVSTQNDVDKGLAALQAAFRDERPLEARISELNYAPYISTRGPGTEKIDQNELSLAELTLRQELKNRPTPAARHALGKVFLAKKEFDEAIKQFDEALKDDPRNAQLYGDLGAAFLEKGKIDREGKEPGKGMEELGRSLEYFNKALELNPNLLEPRFNRALSRQYQSLYGEAEADWQQYLKSDPDSDWAVEARKNLKLIQDQKTEKLSSKQPALENFLSAYRSGDDRAAWDIFRRNYTSADNAISRDLIDAFLKSESADERDKLLSALKYSAQLQLVNTGDAYGVELVSAYSSADSNARSVLLEARKNVSKGYEFFRQSKFVDSFDHFSRAREGFVSVGNNAEALAAEYAIAHGATLQPDLLKSETILTRLIPLCQAKAYKWLLSQCLIEHAHLQANLNNFSRAIDESQRALKLSRELQDVTGTLEGLTQLATLHLFLSDHGRSLSFLHEALEVVKRESIPRTRAWGMLIAVSLNLGKLKLDRAARDYQMEALALAVDTKFPLYISRSFEYLGITYGNLQLFETAIENTRRAYEQGQGLATERNGQSMMAHASLTMGDLYRISGDHAKAVAAYDESARLYDGLGFNHYSYAAHKGKLLSYLVENDSRATQELGVVLALFEDYRERILGERQRSFFFDREQDVYDLAIDFAYSKTGDAELAFQYSETSRSRSLLDLLRHGGVVVDEYGKSELRTKFGIAKPLTAQQIRNLMPANVQILQFAVLKDKVIIWVVTPAKVATEVATIDSARLTIAVADALKSIVTGDAANATEHLSALYDVLVKPIESSLDRDKVLCIIPEKDLNYLPFAALISRKSGRYLVEDFQLMLSPSSSVFIHCTLKAKNKGSRDHERLLAVGNPAFDRQLYSQYSDLPAAEREARGVAEFYGSSRTLIGSHATVPMIKAELLRSDVAHFASHYVASPESSLSSKLLLANVAEQSGELEGRDICRMDLRRTRLVVLSACQTAIDRQFNGEGATGFAKQFMIAGVPVVVASFWPVESESTADLMIAFERNRVQSELPTVEALRRAQVAMISSPTPAHRQPYYWASFVAIGGYAEY